MPESSGLAFSRGLIDRYIQFKLIQRAEQRERERNRRFDLQLQENRRWRQQSARDVESRFRRQEDRLKGTAESLIQQRQSPQRGTKEWALKRGYSDKTAQIYQDRYMKLAPPLATPYQRVTVGRTMMDYSQTDEMYDAGELIMNDAMEELKGQVSFPLRGGAREPTEPVFPSELELQGKLPPDTDAGMFDRLNEQQPRNREELLAEYRRLGGSESAEARKFAEEHGLLD